MIELKRIDDFVVLKRLFSCKVLIFALLKMEFYRFFTTLKITK